VKLVGFCLCGGPEGEVYLTFRSRTFGLGSDRRSFEYLRASDSAADTVKTVKAWIVGEDTKRASSCAVNLAWGTRAPLCPGWPIRRQSSWLVGRSEGSPRPRDHTAEPAYEPESLLFPPRSALTAAASSGRPRGTPSVPAAPPPAFELARERLWPPCTPPMK